MNSILSATPACIYVAVVFACTAIPGVAQDKPADYPQRPIRIIVGVPAGAGNDTVTRAAAQMLSEKWGQSVVVDNRSGAGTAISIDLGAQAPADGYTILSATDTLMLVGAMKRVSFDVRKALEPIVVMTTQPYILVVEPALPAKSVKELIAYSKTKTLTYGSSGIGTMVHLGMERLAALSGANFAHVPYKGIAAYPDLPTVEEAGFPGFKIINSYNLFAPAGTPKPIILAINRVVGEGMHSPAMAQRLAGDGSEPAERMTPEQFKAQFAREYIEVEKQVRDSKIKLY